MRIAFGISGASFRRSAIQLAKAEPDKDAGWRRFAAG
jgi:hypothetical protein